MKLAEYFRCNQIKYTRWAKEINISAPVITNFLKGKAGLSPETALKIVIATGGSVGLADLGHSQLAQQIDQCNDLAAAPLGE